MECQTSWGHLLASSGHSVYGYAVSDQLGLLVASCGHSVYGYAVSDQWGLLLASCGHSVYGYAVADSQSVGMQCQTSGVFCWPLVDTQSSTGLDFPSRSITVDGSRHFLTAVSLQIGSVSILTRIVKLTCLCSCSVLSFRVLLFCCR